ncbi:MAG TPA: hypothetical protein VF699_12720 [Caulobacteraceae bacterium]|jgi:hypothetical protein
MKSRIASAVVIAAWLSCAAASAQDAAPPPRVLEDGSSEVAELIITARRPGHDPSSVTTECLWAHLPADQRERLARGGDAAVRNLAREDELPLVNDALTDGAVAGALRACGAPEDDAGLPYARLAILSFVNENAAARAVAPRGVAETELVAAWNALTPVERERLIAAGLMVYLEEEPEDFTKEAFAILKMLRRLRPLGVFNPLGWSNGSVNHKIIAYYEAHAVRSVMERRF